MMAVGRGAGGAFALALAAWCGLFVAVRLWSGAAPSAVSSLLLAGAPSTSSGSSSSGVYAWGSTNNVKLFKRTHASTHPQRDGWFLSHYVGVEQTAAEFWMNGSQYSSKMATGDGETTGVLFETACGLEGVACCAERASMTTLGTFTFHQFRSWVTPAGDASIDDWVSFWSGLRSFSRAALDVPYDWDAYMSLSTHFYTPRLDAHVRRLVAEAVPFLSRTYANPADGSPAFAVFVNNPYDGHVFAVHAGAVDDDLRRTYFARHLDDDTNACPAANKVAFSRERLDDWWRGLNGTAKDALTGLPDVLAVSVNQPTADAAATAASLAAVAVLPWNFSTTSDADGCAVLEATLPTGKLVFAEALDDAQAYASLRFVEAPSARDGGRPVADYVAAADGNVATYVGENEGWARFLDYHVGLNVPGALDDYRAALDSRDPHYHAHIVPQSGTPDDGSIFAKGASGLCFELHGVFNYTAFDPEPLGSLNFCSADSTCAGDVPLCSGDVLHQSYPGFRVYAENASACDGDAGDCAHYAVAGSDAD